MMKTWLMRGADAGLLVDHFGHQLVGVEATLHQRVDFPVADNLDCLRRRGVAVRRVDKLQAGKVEPTGSRERPDARLGPDQGLV
jgi:hypothetical protein